MHRRPIIALLLVSALAASVAPLACGDDSQPLRAKRIETPDELIGGPSAKGKLGDYLIENGELRAIVAGEGQSWVGSAFGGSLVDLDRVRATRRDDRYGQGWDAFAETFPLANLIIPDPLKPMREVQGGDSGMQVKARVGGIRILDDGSDGMAAIRVEGSGAYLFQAIKFLNKDFLRTYLGELTIDLLGRATPLRELGTVLDPKLDLYQLLDRLQLDFNFTTDYLVQPGQRYVTIRTTVEVAPPGEGALGLCTLPDTCALTREDCPSGFALREQHIPVDGEFKPVPVLCPICVCASDAAELAPFTEQRSIFGDMLGDLDEWTQPDWRGGLLGGDFLFFGGDANIFLPGLGFDEQRRIFENMWQGVGSLGSPLVYPWVAAVAPNVSYAYTTRNPGRRPAHTCPEHRLAILAVSPEGEQAVTQALVTGFGMTAGGAAGIVRGNLVDRNPIVLPVPPQATGRDLGAEELEVWRREQAQGLWGQVQESWAREEGQDPALAGLPALAEPERQQAVAALQEHTLLGLLPAAECQASQLLVPLFTTSATVVMTHEDLSRLSTPAGPDAPADAAPEQQRMRFTWERYLVVGDGDVGSVLETVLELRNEPRGWVQGVVFEAGTARPVHHAKVFAVRDPRSVNGETDRYGDWRSLRAACVAAFGDDGIVSEMQTDLGLDPVHDGDYRGPLPPGRYFLVAKTRNRRASRPVPVTVRPGNTEIAHLELDAPGHLSLRVFDQGGQLSPAKAVLVELDEVGRELDWDGLGYVSMGDARFDLGIRRSEFTVDGELELEAEPGSYRLYVSRGIEYSRYVQELDLQPGRPESVEAVLIHEVDTEGHISADFHVHAQPSVDSSMPLQDRVAAVVAEGLEFVTATDHDHLTDYNPTIRKLGVERFVKSQVGVETSSLEFGHYNGFPLTFDNRDWSEHDPPPWFGMATGDVFAAMRARGAGPPEDFVVEVNHPWDGFMGYFAQGGVRGYDLERATPGMEMCNPQTEEISCDFDAVEVLNEKRFELVHTPTVQEVHEHNRCYQQILATHRPLAFTLPSDAEAGHPDLDDVVCGWLQVDPPVCATVRRSLGATGLDEEQRQDLLAQSDRCDWHSELRLGFARCGRDEVSVIECKRAAIDALKYFSVRRMLQRTPAEQAAFLGMTVERDPECDWGKATAGCTPNVGEDGAPVAGCGEDCLCAACVCDLYPECCLGPEEEGGTGWTSVCADACRGECGACGVQPCTDATQMLDSWFTMLNQGFVVTAVGNSDSHGRMKEVGLPRNFLTASTDNVQALDPADINRAVQRHESVMSTGPFVEASIEGASVGQTARLKEGDGPLKMRVRVQTASWFGVDHLEVYRNGRLVHRQRVAKGPEAIADFDGYVELERPTEDSWYVVITYGLHPDLHLSPTYGALAYGHLLIPTVISIGLSQILGSFDALMDRIEDFGPMLESAGFDLETLLTGLAGGTEMPDNFPTIPLAITNPIWIDVDGGGFQAPDAQDRDADGVTDLPPFCAQACDPNAAPPEEGAPVRSSCGEGQQCRPTEPDSPDGRCVIPVPAACPPDVFATGGSGQPLLTSPGGQVAAGQGVQVPWDATRLVEGRLRRQLMGKKH